MTKHYRNSMMASIHETAEDLYEAGLMEKHTMREFDELCLTPARPLKPEEIRSLRERENVSQVVFAHYLNVTKGIISQWGSCGTTPKSVRSDLSHFPVVAF